MSIHSFNILAIQEHQVKFLNELAFQQPYSNIAHSLKKKLTEIVGHRLASAWLDLWGLSHSGKKLIKESYSYLANLWFYSRRNAIRVMADLADHGFIIKTVSEIKRGLNNVNTYRVCTPEEVLNVLKGFSKRKQVMPNIDYSTQQEVYPEVFEEALPKALPKALPEVIKETIQEREAPKEGDTRGLLDLNVKLPSGKLGEILKGMQDKFKSAPKEESPGKPFSVNPVDGGGDRTVTQRELNIQIYNKASPSESPINSVNHKGELKEPPRFIEDWVKREAWKFINETPTISDKKTVYRQALFFLANNHGYDIKHSLNIFKKRIRLNTWSTPTGMRYKSNPVGDFIKSIISISGED